MTPSLTPAPVDDSSGRGARTARGGRGAPILELAVLGVLREGAVHGYELKKRLDAVLPRWSSVSFGSLYPALARLERGGEVQTVTGSESEPSSPMTGALSGELAAFRSRLRDRGDKASRPAKAAGGRRGRKVYAITPAGTARLIELLTGLDPTDDRIFAVQLAFCRHLSPAERVAVLARRRAEVAARLDEARTAIDEGEGDPTDPWRRSMREHAVRSLELDLHWLDDLVVGEQDPTRAAGGNADPADLAPTLTGGLR